MKLTDAVYTVDAMGPDAFWEIVEAARAGGGPRPLDQASAEALTDLLAARAPEEIVAFELRFQQVHGAVYRWDLWAAGYLIGGGCSDDSFMDFRAGLIALGREWYERASADPDSLAGHPLVISEAAEEPGGGTVFHEDVNYVASLAFDRITGDTDVWHEVWKRRRAGRPIEGPPPVMGEDFDFEDDDEMRRRLPRLAELFL